MSVPRVRCEEHGVRQVPVPWAEENSSFTALFEALVISWLKEASISAVAELMDLTWDQVDGIMQRAVRRGLARRTPSQLRRIGVDETSFQKRHEYVTIVTDLETSTVLYVADDRKASSLEPFFEEREPPELAAIVAVAMDMWKPYISVVTDNLWNAEKKICFDKFHVAKHLGDAVDKVPRSENRALVAEGDSTLVGTKYTWLQNPENMKERTSVSLAGLRRMILKTARAWAIKEHAMCLWGYVSHEWARRAWKEWISWAVRSHLEPMKKVAKIIREHLDGIINGIVLGATNAGSESINSRVQRVKRMACGFRNRERFRNAIYFHLGGLDLSPPTTVYPHEILKPPDQLSQKHGWIGLSSVAPVITPSGLMSQDSAQGLKQVNCRVPPLRPTPDVQGACEPSGHSQTVYTISSASSVSKSQEDEGSPQLPSVHTKTISPSS